MSRARRWAPLALLALLACESETLAPGMETSLSVQIGTEAGFTSSADAGLIRLEGPSPRTVSIQPGGSETIVNLQPGSYTVSLEALLGGRLESYGETTVTVVAGQNRQAGITLLPFIPSITSAPSSASRGTAFTVQFTSVSRASSYVVQWADNPSFSQAQSSGGTGTSASITIGALGTHYVRVFAVNRHGTQGVPSGAVTVVVTNSIPTVTISQPANNSTFEAGASITFQGSATDPEDGPLSGGALVWSSNIDGQIGTGASFSRSDLSEGVHSITLTATDGDGGSNTATRTITVEEPGQALVVVGPGPCCATAAQVGGQVPLPILLDLSQADGLEVGSIELELRFSGVLFGIPTWILVGNDYVITEGLAGEDGTTQVVRAVFERASGHAATAVVGLLTVDPAAVGSGTVSVDVVSAHEPGGAAIPTSRFTTGDHQVNITVATPVFQTLTPGTPVPNLAGGVLYFRIPGVGSPAATASRQTDRPRSVLILEDRPPPAGVITAFPDGSVTASELGGNVSGDHVRLLRGLLSDAPSPAPSSAMAQGQTLLAELTGGTGDAILLTRFGVPPTPNDFDCLSRTEGNEEVCTHLNPADGDWYVMVRPFGAHNAYTGVTLRAFLYEKVTITTASLPDGILNTPYEVTLAASQGDGEYEWSHLSGPLPPGLDLAEDGTLSGTPTAAGDYTFTVRVVSAGQSDDRQFTVSIQEEGVPLAYVFARQPMNPLYTPDPLDGINLSGGSIQIRRDGVGSYTVTFNGLGVGALGSSFTALVNTVSVAPNPELTQAAPACRMSLVNAAAPLRVLVECEHPVTGAAMDSPYRVLVVGNGVLVGQQAGFSLHHLTGTMSTYTPDSSFSWNSNGAAQTVTPRGGGEFDHNMGLNITEPFTVAVSTIDFSNRAGNGSHSCIFSEATFAIVEALCLNRSNVPVDKRHTVLALEQGRVGEAWAYTFVNEGLDPDGVVPGVTATSAGGVTGEKQGVGRWRLTFDGITLDSTPGITTTPFAASWAYCSHHRVSSQPLQVDVACYNGNGVFTDFPFTILILR